VLGHYQERAKHHGPLVGMVPECTVRYASIALKVVSFIESFQQLVVFRAQSVAENLRGLSSTNHYYKVAYQAQTTIINREKLNLGSSRKCNQEALLFLLF